MHKKNRIYGLLSLLALIFACAISDSWAENDNRHNINGIVFIKGQPAYVVARGQPTCAYIWSLALDKANETKAPSQISWANDAMIIPDDLTGRILPGNRREYSYRITKDKGQISLDGGSWREVNLRILDSKPRRLSTRRTFLMRVYIESDFFKGIYDIVETVPAGHRRDICQ